ncbi:MAG: SIS domain-containing protein [Myxococcales bacterium]|nr:SIS domain-containing protein [Myxococcota bacterium]MDW8283688.1 SIS domain-containing protein [Myxococcales bacterium]
MCGVIGLLFEHYHPRLGHIAAELLRALEYRGYDSTGAAVQGDGTDVTLRKGVGAPSVLVEQLGITGLSGRILCGQVRWATFGAVTADNAQPHLVRCHAHLYGAHNGNVTNCDDLKRRLVARGHQVLSDNDGEMVVHLVEHHFAELLQQHKPEARQDPELRRRTMRSALIRAADELRGSYAAVVVDPVTRCAWAVKQGSSLYFGFGTCPEGGRFTIASSDLSAVLRLTRTLVPLSEGEFVEYTAIDHQVYCVRERLVRDAGGERLCAAGEPVPRAAVRSRLRAADTRLLPGMSCYMEQEIAAQPEVLHGLLGLLSGGPPSARAAGAVLAAAPESDRQAVLMALAQLREAHNDEVLPVRFAALQTLPAFAAIQAALPPSEGASFPPPDPALLEDLSARGAQRAALDALEALLLHEEATALGQAADAFCDLCEQALACGGRLFFVCCGSSYHAACAGALFFNDMAGVQIDPVLPGDFRGRHARSLRDGDLLVAISQSGETKDVLDVVNQVLASGRRVGRVALVNNVNSTLAQEKSDLVLPLRCGPEVAVPATKSFLGQMALLYALAIRLGERRAPPEARQALERRRTQLLELPELVRRSIVETVGPVEEAARLLHLRPSVHILATRLTPVALEGALKIREVVLNHTQGIEGSEFKHGPNTILGQTTLFGPAQLEALLCRLGAEQQQRVAAALARGEPADAVARSVGQEVSSALHRPELRAALHVDYPLIYVCGPDEMDVALTVSQINTHKIRGACTIVLAEENQALRQAAEKPPADNPGYSCVYVPLPPTGDTLLTVFSASVVLQRLALRMSLLKMAYLDQLGVRDHGVHPDVPRNVSKSITVD